MELIIKPTEVCNFKCTFCSSSNISDVHTKLLDLQYVYDFLDRFPNTTTIIINGGDPLVIKPSYYFDIIKFIEAKKLHTTLSFTTNLWAFYKNPDNWVELFKHPRVGVTTSFNYGDTRRITKDKIFTEEIFLEISNLFLDKVGYRPDFISVINDENDQYAIQNVELAKKLNVECKLNYAMSSGEQIIPYQLSKIYKIYLEIYNKGLANWEFNTKQMMTRLKTGATVCPQSRNCDSGIRALNPGGDYYSCGSFADDREQPISFNKEIKGEFFTPLSDNPELFSLKDECLSCPMFKICNGCRKTIKDMKKYNIVEEHCSLMKNIAKDILKVNV